MSEFWRRLRERLTGGQVREPRYSSAAARELSRCMHEAVYPALRGAREVLESEGYQVEFEEERGRAGLRVKNEDGTDVFFLVEGRLYHRAAFAFPTLHGRRDRPQTAKLHIETNGGAREHRCRFVTAQGLRDECLGVCRKWLAW